MTTSPRDRAAAVAEKVAGEHGSTERRCVQRPRGISEWDNYCRCGEKLPWPKVECENTHRAHLAAALADALVAEGLVGDGEVREWGVQHIQGLAPFRDERQARYEAQEFRARGGRWVGSVACSRIVGPWEVAE